MFTLDAGVPAELSPLSWLVGVWEGSGVIDYAIGDDDHRSAEFGQRISFSHDGQAYLNYAASSWILGGDEDDQVPLTAEIGYWRLGRALGEGDPGPGMLPASAPRPYRSAEAVETLRNAAGGFDLEVSILHPTGVSELYLGQIKGPRIDLATDAVVRTSSSKEYNAATRMYGLVEGHLLWAWDMAALGQSLRTHASARLARAE